jgi:tRNA(adenine34) deaminase
VLAAIDTLCLHRSVAEPIEIYLAQSMTRCIELGQEAIRNKNYGLGSLVMNEQGVVIAESGSQLNEGNDPSAHPEMEVIRAASERLQRSRLASHYLVTTLEPCVMCTGAAFFAEMNGIAYGATQEDAIEFGRTQDPRLYHTWRQIAYKARDVLKKADNPKPVLYEGVLREECQQLFTPVPRRRKAL